MNHKEARGWLTEGEREELYQRARYLPPEPMVVNIGVEYGASLACLAAGMYSGLLIGVDIDVSKDESESGALLIQMDSGVFVSTWPRLTGGHVGINLLFIDGDHSRDGVTRDLPWTWWVMVNGVVIFHDCYEWPPAPPRTVRPVSPYVNEVVSEWYDANRDTFSEEDHVDSMRIFRRIV
jgi:hypothetical protein